MDMSGVRDLMWLTPEQVVDAGLADLRAGKPVSVPGWQYKAIVGIGSLLPRSLVGGVASRSGRRFKTT
jgi:short-subunit dehydrogenase